MVIVVYTVPSEQYYLLSDKLPEDRELRIRLQQQKLVQMILDCSTIFNLDRNFVCLVTSMV